MSDNYDDVLRKVGKTKSETRLLKLENQSLKMELSNTRRDLNLCRKSVNDMEQYTRRDCLEIKGIPEAAKENTTELTIQTAALIGIELTKEDISTSHRLPKPSYRETVSDPPESAGERQRTPTIIVKFVRRETRDAFYRARKHLRDRTTADLGLGRIAENNIYISESLSPANKELFKSCLSFKRDRKFKFIWTYNGKIYLRKSENSPATVIRCLKDLQEISGGASAVPDE